MISLAGRDILHSWGKFVFTGIGLGLLIGVTLVMAGVYRGTVSYTHLDVYKRQLSMAAGEYVSVSSQADTELADTAKESAELLAQPEAELHELTGIYERRGLSPKLAREVAVELTAHDALSTHLRDELGIHDATRARPIQAAFSSAVSFCFGAALPIMLVLLWKGDHLEAVVGVASLALLAGLAALAQQLGRASMVPGASRALIRCALAMAITAGIGIPTAGFGVR